MSDAIPLTPEERQQLETQLVWVQCPICEGNGASGSPGVFCSACTTKGRVLQSTANILNNMLPFIKAGWRREQALATALPKLRMLTVPTDESFTFRGCNMTCAKEARRALVEIVGILDS